MQTMLAKQKLCLPRGRGNVAEAGERDEASAEALGEASPGSAHSLRISLKAARLLRSGAAGR